MASGDFVVSSTMAGSLTQTNGYWSSTPNYGNNTSTMSVSFYVTKRSGFSTTFGAGTWGIIVDGVDYQTSYTISVPGNSTVLVHSVSGILITHNPNGTRSVNISIYGNIPATSWTSTSGSTTAVLEDTLPNPVFTDATLASPANVGTAYSDGVLASNAASYSVLSGALPDGLSLNTSTGAITSGPAGPTTPGVFTFVIRATNGSGTVDTGTLTITVLGGGRVWNGTAFVAGTTRVWNGSTWVNSITKVWNGSTWVNAT
jgi:hypothetical protein